MTKRLLSAAILALAAPANAAPLDDAKFLMCRSVTTDALKALGAADGQNYIWYVPC